MYDIATFRAFKNFVKLFSLVYLKIMLFKDKLYTEYICTSESNCKGMQLYKYTLLIYTYKNELAIYVAVIKHACI